LKSTKEKFFIERLNAVGLSPETKTECGVKPIAEKLKPGFKF